MTTFIESLKMVAPLGLILGSFALLFLGEYVGARIGKVAAGSTSAILFLVALIFLIGASPLGNGSLPGSSLGYIGFVLSVIGATGLSLGVGKRRIRELYERELAHWRQQLAADRQKDGDAICLAIDYQKIGSLLAKLGRYQEAVDEYRHGLLIMELKLKGHPVLRDYYTGYLSLLNDKSQAEERARVAAKMAALPAF
jgi:tetratricopeptide (TPR) repeat protein